MNIRFLLFIKNSSLGLAVFVLLSLPTLFVDHSLPKQKVRLTFANPGRHLASTQPAVAEVAKKQCEPKTRWRYRCDENQKNCFKDRRVSYLECQGL